MILSASVNADVPARYGAWFQRRLEAGFLRVAGSDPWKQRKISLDPEQLDGIVFWTRDVAPFLPVLDALSRRGTAFVVQYATTGDVAGTAQAAVAAIRHLEERYGRRAVVWRYDPLILDALHPAASHVAAMTALARSLTAVVDEVVVAFARPRPQHKPAARDVAGHDEDGGSATRRELVKQLAEAARASGMRLSVCSDAEALAPGASPSRCIDARRLSDIAGRVLDAPTAGFMRDCLCALAIDIGDHGGTEPECFCGARPKRALRLRHDPESEFLFEPAQRFKSARSGDLPF